MAEDGADLWRLLHDEKGYLYICGGTTMGRDVVKAVQEMGRAHGKLDAAKAEAFVAAMQAEGRLVQELWS